MDPDQPELYARCDRCHTIGGCYFVRHLILCYFCAWRGA